MSRFIYEPYNFFSSYASSTMKPMTNGIYIARSILPPVPSYSSFKTIAGVATLIYLSSYAFNIIQESMNIIKSASSHSSFILNRLVISSIVFLKTIEKLWTYATTRNL